MVETIAFCGRQNITLRGLHNKEDSAHLRSKEEQSGNAGNFLALVKFRMQCGGDIEAYQHITKESHVCVMQNQLSGCIGDWSLESMLEVRKARFYSILADEAVDISVELKSRCLWC